jgi:hypothetical protein
MRDLGRAPERELALAPLGEEAARLDRRARRAVVDDPLLDDHVGVAEGGLDVPTAERPLEHRVGAELVVDDRRAVLERLLGVDDDGQRVIVDDDLAGRVDDGVLVGAEHDGHRLADVADLVAGQRPVVGDPHLDARREEDHRRRRGQALHVRVGVHGHDPRLLARGLGVDREDPRVRLGRPHDGGVQHPRQHHVVGVGRPAGDQPGVLLALERATDEAVAVATRVGDLGRLGPGSAHQAVTSSCAGCAAEEDIPPAAARTALTMFW